MSEKNIFKADSHDDDDLVDQILYEPTRLTPVKPAQEIIELSIRNRRQRKIYQKRAYKRKVLLTTETHERLRQYDREYQTSSEKRFLYKLSESEGLRLITDGVLKARALEDTLLSKYPCKGKKSNLSSIYRTLPFQTHAYFNQEGLQFHFYRGFPDSCPCIWTKIKEIKQRRLKGLLTEKIVNLLIIPIKPTPPPTLEDMLASQKAGVDLSDLEPLVDMTSIMRKRKARLPRCFYYGHHNRP